MSAELSCMIKLTLSVRESGSSDEGRDQGNGVHRHITIYLNTIYVNTTTKNTKQARTPTDFPRMKKKGDRVRETKKNIFFIQPVS